MYTEMDWVAKKTEISLLLPPWRHSSGRKQLLASLEEYSKAAVLEARVQGSMNPSSAQCAEALSGYSARCSSAATIAAELRCYRTFLTGIRKC